MGSSRRERAGARDEKKSSSELRRRRSEKKKAKKDPKDMNEDEMVAAYTMQGATLARQSGDTRAAFEDFNQLFDDAKDMTPSEKNNQASDDDDDDDFERQEKKRLQLQAKERQRVAEERDIELKERIETLVNKSLKEIEDETRKNYASRAFVHTPVVDTEAQKNQDYVVSHNRVATQLRSFIIYLFLGIIGIVTATIGVTLDIVTGWIRKFHVFLATGVAENADDFSVWGYLVWIIFGVFVAFLAAKLTDKISPAAVGSGIPELKCYLNGADRVMMGGGNANRATKFLSFRTLISKLVGLTLAIGSGLWVGKEGPYTHTSAIICNNLFRFFPSLNVKKRGNSVLRLQLIGSAVGIGVASHFGSVLGGVLFSVEVTSTYYPVRNYWFSAVGCGVGGLVFRTLHNLYFEKPPLTSVIHTYYDIEHRFTWYDIFFFLFIGITCGLFSALFVRMVREIILFRKKHMAKYRMFVGPIGYTVIVALVISLLSYPNLWGSYMSMGGYPALQDLVNSGSLDDGDGAKIDIVGREWTEGQAGVFDGVWKNLLIFFVFKWLCTPLAITAGVPAGLYVPTLLLGAAWGRLIGEVLNIIADDPNFISLPGGYATVAAAAMTGGITQTYSTSIIVLEITGQLVFSLPVILGVTVSIIVTRFFYESIFDEIAQVKNMMFLAELRYWRYETRADHIMRQDYAFLTRKMSLHAVLAILRARPMRQDFPVLRSPTDSTLLGSVERSILEDLVYEPIDKKEDRSARQYWFNASNVVERLPKPASELNKFVRLPTTDVPFQLLPSTSMYAIHILFITLRLRTAFVTERGILRGIIGRHRLQGALANPNANAQELGVILGDQ